MGGYGRCRTVETHSRHHQEGKESRCRCTHLDDCRLCGCRGRHSCAAANGGTDLGRPRPLRTLSGSRLRYELPFECGRKRYYLHQWRQRHLPIVVLPGGGRLPHRRARGEPQLSHHRLVYQPDATPCLQVGSAPDARKPSHICLRGATV